VQYNAFFRGILGKKSMKILKYIKIIGVVIIIIFAEIMENN